MSRLEGVLYQHADLMCRAERLLLAKLSAGRSFTGDLHGTLYKPLGITSIHLNMIHRQLQGKLSSVRELAKARVASLDRKIKAKLDDIARKEKAIVKLRIDIASKADAVRDLSESVDVWRERLRGDPAQGTSKNLWPLKNRLAVFHAAVDAVSSAQLGSRINSVVRKGLVHGF